MSVRILVASFGAYSNAMSSRKAKGKTSQILIQPTGKGPDAYRDVEWKTISDDEARAMEKEQSLAWKILTNSQVQSLLGLEVEEVEKSLSEMLDLPGFSTDLKQATLLDYYTSAFWWAKEEGFNAQQVSGFFTVVHTLMTNVKDNMTASENLNELRKMMVGVGTNVDEANGGLDFLSLKQAKLISSFLETTLFQHYSLYHFLHHGDREEQIVCTDLCVETLPPAGMPYPAPLDEGIEEEVYVKHIAPPPEDLKEDDNTEDKDAEPAGEDKTEEHQNMKEGEEDETKDVLAGVTSEEVKTVFDKVAQEMFAGLQDEIALRLKEREADIITRINRIHRIAET